MLNLKPYSLTLAHRIKSGWSRRKFSTISRVCAQNQFAHPDVGSIGQIAEIDIFVISYPKCGTTAIQKGFDRLGRSVLHAHNNPTTYAAVSNGEKLRAAGVTLESLCHFRQHLSSRPLFFFFGYREPVSWYLSLAAHFGVRLDDNLRHDFLRNIKSRLPWKRYSFQASQSVVESATGIPLLGGKFDHEKGYTVRKRGNVTLVLYRVDHLEKVAAYIKSEIEPGFELRPDRINTDAHYLAARGTFQLPPRILREIYATPLFSYFYSAEEAGRLIEKYAEDSGGLRPEGKSQSDADQTAR